MQGILHAGCVLSEISLIKPGLTEPLLAGEGSHLPSGEVTIQINSDEQSFRLPAAGTDRDSYLYAVMFI